MADPYIGEIRLLPYTYAPEYWVPCDGRLLPISQYNQLFLLIGTTYGGDGKTTFGVPNLSGSIPVGAGGAGVSLKLGETTGVQTFTLTDANLPAHTHTLNARSTSTATDMFTTPTSEAEPGWVMWQTSSGTKAQQAFSDAASPDGYLSLQAIAFYGTTSQPTSPHSNMQPYLPLNYMIATAGVYPTPD